MEETLRRKFLEWLEEDAPYWDETTELLVPRSIEVKAYVIAKAEGVLACSEEVESILKSLGFKARSLLGEGSRFSEGDRVMEIVGSARRLLYVERTLLNVMMYCCGIATATAKLVELAKEVNPKVKIAATRKVVPGMRSLAKKAVRVGGGDTHRLGLSDSILIKDNHLKVVGDLRKAIELAKGTSFVKKVEVEVSTLQEALEAARGGADIIMLDNFEPEEVGRVIEELEREGLRDKVILEVSGGIREENLADYLRYDVDVVSCGWITHSAPAVDLSLEVVEVLS